MAQANLQVHLVPPSALAAFIARNKKRLYSSAPAPGGYYVTLFKEAR